MKCPYQKKVIHIPEAYLDMKTALYAEDITQFCDCLESECPFYYITEKHKPSDTLIKEHCRRVESEVKP